MNQFLGKVLFLLLCLCSFMACSGDDDIPGKEEDGNEQETPALVEIADPEFKKFLTSAKLWVMTDWGYWFQSDQLIDSDGDGEINEEEALNIRYLKIDTWHIRTLEGINKMRNLEVLVCKGHFVERENMTWNIYESGLELLDVSGLPKLKKIDCQFNINKNKACVVQMDNCPALENAYFTSNTFSAIYARNCSALKEVHYASEEVPLKIMDVSGCFGLERIVCIEAGLQQLNVENCVALQEITCPWNELADLSLTDCTGLKLLNCEMNKLKSLDVSSNTKLQHLNCIQEDLGGGNTLTALYVNENQLNSVPEGWMVPTGVKIEKAK